MATNKIDGERPMHLTKCPVIRALEIVGMLTRALQGLESHDLISRKALCHIPPHVEYALTDSCKALLPALEIINEWGKNQMSPALAAGCRVGRESGKIGEESIHWVDKGKASMGAMD